VGRYDHLIPKDKQPDEPLVGRYDHLIPKDEESVQPTLESAPSTWWEDLLNKAEDGAGTLSPDVAPEIEELLVPEVAPEQDIGYKPSASSALLAASGIGSLIPALESVGLIGGDKLDLSKTVDPFLDREVDETIPEEDRPYLEKRPNEQIVKDVLEENQPAYTGFGAKIFDLLNRTDDPGIGLARSIRKSVGSGKVDTEDFTTGLSSLSPSSLYDLFAKGKPQTKGQQELTGESFAVEDLGIPEDAAAFNMPSGLKPSSLAGKLNDSLETLGGLFGGGGGNVFNTALESILKADLAKKEVEDKGLKGILGEATSELKDFMKPSPVLAKDVVGLLSSIGLDPTTYLTAGAAPAAKQFGGKLLNSKGIKYIKGLIPMEVEKLFKSMNEDQLKGLVASESKLAGSTITQDQALLRAALKKVERNFEEMVRHPNADLDRFIDKGGIKMFGRSVVSGDNIAKAIDATPGLSSIKKWFGESKNVAAVKSIFSRDALLEYRNTRAQEIFDKTGVDVIPKTQEAVAEFFNNVGAIQDDVAKGIADSFTITKTVNGVTKQYMIDDAGRKLIHNALENAQDESGILVADYLVALEVGEANAKDIINRGSQIIKDLNANTKKLAQLEFDKILTGMEGIGLGAVGALKDAGITTVKQVAELDPKALLKILNKKLPTLPKQIGIPTAESMILQAQNFVFYSEGVASEVKKIVGIGNKRNEFLEAAGITDLTQIANMTPKALVKAFGKSAEGLGIISMKKNMAFAESVAAQAKDALLKVNVETPILSAKRLELQQQLDEVTALLDSPDANYKTIKELNERVKNYKQTLKSLAAIDKKKFDAVAMKHIKTLPKEFQKPAYETWRALRRAEKQDTKAGLLTKLIPNYVPRKYEGLFDPVATASGAIKKSVSRNKRKIYNSADAKKYAIEHGGEMVEDIVVPTAERIIKGRKANAFKQFEDKLKTIYELKKVRKIVDGKPKMVMETLDDVVPGYSDWVNQTQNFKQNPNPILVAAINGMDRVMNVYKGMLTSMFPAFHARNMISNKFLSFLGTGADILNPLTVNHGLNIKQGLDGYITDVFGIRHNYDEIRTLAEKNGVTRGFFKGDIVETVQETIEGSKTINPIEMGRKVGQYVEDLDRLTLYSSYIKKGLDPVQAAKQVNKFLFDYQNLSWFEKTAMKRAFPFYTFKRKSFELFAEQLIKQPRVFSGVNKLVDFLSENDLSPEDIAKMPTYLQNKILITTPTGIVTGLDLGMEDFMNVVTAMGGDQKALRGQMAQMNPVLVAAIEYSMERQLFNDKTVEEAAKNLNDIPEFIMKSPFGKMLGAYIDYDPLYDENGKVVGKKKVWKSTEPYRIWALRKMPTSRTMGQMQDIDDLGTGETNILKIMTGLGVQETPKGLSDFFEQKRLQKALEVEGLGKTRKQFYLTGEEKSGVDYKLLESFIGDKAKSKKPNASKHYRIKRY
jgi:predicted flap endonuclease-1-like 5' DNA nuclease